MKKYLIIFSVFIPFFAQSQIINIESLRRVTDTVGWSGFTRLDLYLIKNKNSILGVSNRTRVQYKNENHLWLFVSDFDFKEANSKTFVSKNAQHLRYNYRLKPSIALESFIQVQEDKISAIRFRGLTGAGLRFKLSKSEDYKFYLGTLVMFENEHSKNDTFQEIHNDWRSSSYFSMSLFPTDNITIVSTTYYQPRFDKISDFRATNQTSIVLKVVKNLSFSTTFTYQFDEFPVVGIPKEQYRLTNGIVYSF